MSYEVFVTDQPDRRVVAVRIFQHVPAGRFLCVSAGSTWAWEVVPEGQDAHPTFIFGREVAEQLTHRLMDYFHMDRPEQTEQRRIAYLEGEQSSMRRHLDGLESLFRRVITLAPEGPIAVPGELNIVEDDRVPAHWRRRALDAESVLRDVLGETDPPQPPRRILDIEPAPDAPLSRTVPGFAGEVT